MKSFCRSLLTQLLALVLFVVGSLVLLFLVTVVVDSKKTTVAPNSVLILNLSASFPESVRDDSPVGLIQRTINETKTGVLPLPSVLQALDRASRDNSISALYLTGNVVPSSYSGGPAALKELRDAILRFKLESGKPVIAYNHAWTKWEYYLCSCASKLYVNPSGEVDCTGILAESTFFAGALKKYGVDVQVTRVGKYKSAVEPYLLEKMSTAGREQLSLLLDDIWSNWKEVIAADRKLTSVDIQCISDTQGILTAPKALKAGLVDKLVGPDQVLDELKALAGRKSSDVDFPQVAMDAYMRTETSAKSKNKIALVVAEGEIVEGNGRGGQVGGDKLSRDLRELRLDPQVKAIVMRVNSPGGSAMASELIQREIILARKVKPVVISMGSFAASGGYWISTYGDRIFAEPNTITGSIGVYGLFPNIKKLAGKHGVAWDSVQTSKLSGMTTITRPKSTIELAKIQELVDDVYDKFLDRVSISRGIDKDRVNEIAQGRVWSGRQALKIGLVDELGGIRDAVNYAAKLAKIDGDYKINMFAEPRTPLERIIRMLCGEESHAFSESRGGFIGDVCSRFDNFTATMQALNDPHGVYVRMPLDVHFK
jgi:protease-4